MLHIEVRNVGFKETSLFNFSQVKLLIFQLNAFHLLTLIKTSNFSNVFSEKNGT
ncbi:hypothetical protein NIES4106_04330 [Fischerella sp. NIES-4106]|nr:hypothetical protein NIES4106_04330 [Fischerella sp. NIES-4106]